MVTTFKANTTNQSSRQTASLGTFTYRMAWNTTIETNHFLIASFVIVLKGSTKAARLWFDRVLTICFIVSHFPATIANGGYVLFSKSVQHGLRTGLGTWYGHRRRTFGSQRYPQLSSAKFLEAFYTIMCIVFQFKNHKGTTSIEGRIIFVLDQINVQQRPIFFTGSS